MYSVYGEVKKYTDNKEQKRRLEEDGGVNIQKKRGKRRRKREVKEGKLKR